METEERKFGDYTVMTSIWIGNYEIAVCENPTAHEKDEIFLCGYIESNGIYERMTDCMVSDSYTDIAACFGERIAEKARDFDKEAESIQSIVGDNSPLMADTCIPITGNDVIKDKIIVLKADAFRPEYQRATQQLILCTGGFGAQANARGRSCFGIRLFDGKQTQNYRAEVLGVMPEDKLPDWAKERLSKYRDEQKKADKKRESRSER